MVGALSVFLTILVVDLSCANPQWPPHWEHGPAPCPPEAYVPHPPQPAQHPYYPPYSPEPCPLYLPPPPHHPSPPPSPPPPPHPSSYYCPSLSSPHGHVPPPPYSHWPPYQPKPQPGFYSPPHYHKVPAIAPGEEDENIFPSDFSFGVGNGAYHIEGASEQDCKGQNIWDHWLLSGGISNIDDYSTGEYASDSYNHILEDIEIFNNLTISHYRFSISWARIIPAGTGTVNQAGINHYKHLIHLLKINQIEPMVTIYHGDLPQALQDQGGMLSPLFTDWYLEYVRVLFENYGDEVKYWFTFNDPISVCERGYSKGNFAPGYTEVYHENAYRCGHNLLLAHAAAYHLYDGCFRPKQQGKISFAIMSRWYEPATDCESDRQAAETKLQFTLGWFMHPIYVGDYPQVMKDRVAWKSQLEGRCESRLPEFTHFEIEYIKNTHDFFSLSYLQWVECTPQSPEVYYLNTCYDDAGVEVIEVPGNNAPGLRKLIHWINVNYHYPSIFVVFNGYGTTSRCLSDWDRIDYIKAVLRQIRWAQIYDCARIYGYTYFSYIDGFEWWRGYTMKYGLYDVDFSCPYKTRTPRESAVYYQKLCRTHHI